MAAPESSATPAAEPATVPAASESAAVRSTAAATAMSTATATAMSTATAMLSKGWGAYGQKRRQRTDGPQGGPITENTVLRLHDAYSDAGFFSGCRHGLEAQSIRPLNCAYVQAKRIPSP